MKTENSYLLTDEFNEKFGLKVNYLQYFQITAAIPSSLKQAALLTPISSEFLFSTPDLLYQSEKTTLSLSKMRCKHYYKLLSALCQNLPELKNGKNISQTVFLTGEAI